MLNEHILINVTAHETRVALVQHGAVQELHLERAATRGIVGNIYLGKVLRVLPGMQSAFIDIGMDRAAFLHIADIWEFRQQQIAHKLAHKQNQNQNQPNTPLPPIEKMIFEGQALMVQVAKDPIGNKGARLTTQISLAGRVLVHLPQDPHIGVSQRIENDAEREVLREKLTQMVPENSGGFIVRTNAEDATDDEFLNDVRYLQSRWQEVLLAAKTQAAPSLIYQDLNLCERVLRDLVGQHTHSIMVDCPTTLIKLQDFAARYTTEVLDKLKSFEGERPLFDLYSVEEEIQKALDKRVDLKSGGYLIIDQTEALTSIDVNTGGFIGTRNFEDTIYKTNLEAAQSIARQLRLRNLGGIVVIDFIDMRQAEHQESVLAEFKKTLSRDKARTSVMGFSALGLVEMTRKRTRESLAQQMCEPCPTCLGKGRVKTTQTVAYDIMREIMREAQQFNPNEFKIVAHPSVIELLLEDEADHLARLESDIGKPITLLADVQLTQDTYDIVLG